MVQGNESLEIFLTLSFFSTIISMVLSEFNHRNLPASLSDLAEQININILKKYESNPVGAWGRRLVVLGYLGSLFLLFINISQAKWVYLLCTVGWTYVSFLDAPQINSKSFTLAYEISLIFNGLVLGLLFFAGN